MLRSFNPSTGELVGEVEETPVASIEERVARARAAQPAWGEKSPAERAEIFGAAGPRLRERIDEYADLITREMGKPLADALGEARTCANGHKEKLAGMAEALAPQVREGDGVRSTLYHDPFGVAACISPWNFPLLMPNWQLLPALMAGNAVLFKPSEETPLSGQAYAETLASALPEGVLQIVHGADAQGKALVASDVDLVVFTGSREAGKHILAEASKGLKRVVLELGGKDPLIVLEDADLEAAAKFAAHNSFRNAGQVCISTERIYVDERVHDRFVDLLVDRVAKMPVGDGFGSGVKVGPMVNARQRDHVQAQLAAAEKQGATVRYRGEAPEGENFLPLTVLTDVAQSMDIAREETFGPVACVLRTTGDAEAIEMANDSPFGLGAVVFGSEERAAAVGRRLGAGMIGVNKGIYGAPGTPWVGAHESGYGYHSGPEGHRQFAQVRVVSTPA